MNPSIRDSLQRSMLCATMCLVFAGCAGGMGGLAGYDSERIGAVQQLPLNTVDVKDKSWWALRTRMHWPNQQEPDWALDALVANEVYQPILTEFSTQLPLWRFHRRAGRDNTGHEFALIFLGSAETAKQIAAQADSNPIASMLRERGIIEDISSGPFSTPPSGELSATSDPHWPKSLQAAWPMFIMGASSTWLALVRAEMGSETIDKTSVLKLLTTYRIANAKVSEIWQEHAEHALFHHLSAAFGYVPVNITKRVQF